MEIRVHLTEQISSMYEHITTMGAMVEEALHKTMRALETTDHHLVREVIQGDAQIDRMHMWIDDQCAQLIATEQPVATDLRKILATMQVCGALERIGDHVRHLARSVDTVADATFRPLADHIQKMATLCGEMLHDSINAFIRQDTAAAEEIAKRDDRIDAMHKILYKRVLEIMHDNPDKLDEAVSLMFLNRFLERLGDHVTNVCEWIIYSRRGNHPELNP